LAMQPDAIELDYRLATPADIPYLGPLIEASVRGLQANDYSPSQIDQAIGTWLGLDTQLVADQTYFAVEVRENPDRLPTIGGLAACGGWSRRKTPYGSDHRPGRDNSFLDPLTDAAKIRAFFVHPAWARRGIGTRILQLCEEAAAAEGFRRFEMGATLTGIPLYRRHGYVEGERVELPLRNGETLPVVKMEKRL
jgi:GNAT superfamily N-acetyltransferase